VSRLGRRLHAGDAHNLRRSTTTAHGDGADDDGDDGDDERNRGEREGALVGGVVVARLRREFSFEGGDGRFESGDVLLEEPALVIGVRLTLIAESVNAHPDVCGGRRRA